MISRLRPQRPLTLGDARRNTRGRHGLSSRSWEAALAAQAYRCAICGTDISGPRASAVDHDHQVSLNHSHPARRGCPRCNRSVLCVGCNLVIGHAAEDPDRLRKVADYLERWHRKLR